MMIFVASKQDAEEQIRRAEEMLHVILQYMEDKG